MAHPNIHAKSSAKKYGGVPEDYLHIQELSQNKSCLTDYYFVHCLCTKI